MTTAIHRAQGVKRLRASEPRPLVLRAVVKFVATLDYVTRDEDGQYIDHNLYRVPVSVSAI